VAGPRLGTFEADAVAPKANEQSDERGRLIAALEKDGGNVSAIARAFATSRSSRGMLDPEDFGRR